ncbi:MAG: hypothetical protein H6Q77_1439 [Gemmatimonadetes bacterium]|nr:hypothetical protein [Gemmatimonadota bacterium]
MLLALLALLQQPVAPPPPAKPAAPPKLIERVEVIPASAEVGVGQTLQLAAKAYDASGNVLPDASFRWFTGGDEGSVSETGLVKAGYRGRVRVTVAASVPGSKPAFGEADVKVIPSPPARIVVAPSVSRLVVGTRVSITGTPYSHENDRRYDQVTFTSSNPKAAQVTPDGRVLAVAPGSATITARAAGATQAIPVQVVAGPVSKVTLAPDKASVLTGDVVRFKSDVRGAGGRSLCDVSVRWTLEAGGPEASASIDADGAFVAETPGKYTVTASVGGASADAVIEVARRKVGRGFQVVGRVPVKFSTAEAWVHPSNTCVYLSTIADRVYAIDITTPSAPKIVDSMMTNARIVNDVMTTEDGKFGAFSREGASDRKNGIVIFEASDPCHPKPIAEYTETVQGGVHSSYVYQGHVYLTDDATGSMRVIDITDPYKPHEVARFQTEQTEEGRYLHDIMVVDGLAYLSYWNDGLVIVDVGNGMKGGSPERPVLVSQAKYDLQELYTRVEQLWGLGARGTHTAWRHKNYVFVGDEVYASRAATGLKDGNNLTFGRMTVFDVSNIEQPKIVAWYEPTDGGVHNIWVAGDTLYLGNYQGGARAVDISGELKGDLLKEGREISWILTADAEGNRPRATFAWGAVVKNGYIYVPDINSGLWILKLEPKAGAATP